MIHPQLRRRARGAAVLLASFAIIGACSDSDPVDPDPHPNINSVVVEVEGGNTVTFNRSKIANGQLMITEGAMVTVSFRDPDGVEEENAHDAERFDLRVNFLNGNPAGLMFTPSPGDEFSGTFARTTPSATPVIVQFELWHASAERPHDDGKWNVEAIIQ